MDDIKPVEDKAEVASSQSDVVEALDTSPKSNIVIHSKQLKHNVENDVDNFYHSSAGKKTIADGLEHQSNVSGDANDINRAAHAEGRGPNDDEIGGFLDRLENKHSHRPRIKKASRNSSTVGNFVVRNGKVVPTNQRGAEMNSAPSRRIKPPWVR